jgi:hypothetical protein
MAIRDLKTLEKDVREKGKEDGKRGEACRCKEASNMTPKELLGLMMSDLAFWKKEKKK